MLSFYMHLDKYRRYKSEITKNYQLACLHAHITFDIRVQYNEMILSIH